MKDTLNIPNRKLIKKKHYHLGPRTETPTIYYAPNITESGNCYFGTTPEFLLPPYQFQYDRPNRLTVSNPYEPLPEQGYYPPVTGNMRRVFDADNNAADKAMAQLIRDPQLRYINDRKRPDVRVTMHGIRPYKTVKQVDPDLEETFKYAKMFYY